MAHTQLVVGGVDTHADTHTAAVIDGVGRMLGCQQFAVSPVGYQKLLAWMRGHGDLQQVGVEGTGSYGAGLARHLSSAGITVVEVDRPDRKNRRKRGKSDPIDAEAAARVVLAGTATGTPKSGTGPVEAIRMLRIARRGAVKARTAALNAMVGLVITAPDELRASLDGLRGVALVAAAVRLRPSNDLTDPTQAAKRALRRLARRCQQLTEEITDADTELHGLVKQTAAGLLEQFGVGAEVAGQLLITAGDNPHRLHSDAAFAALCGVSPLPASSGRTDRHRLNQGGDRDANCALHTVVLARMGRHQPTRDYVTRRTAQGLSKKEIMRCLKRYVARELLPHIKRALTTANTDEPTATTA